MILYPKYQKGKATKALVRGGERAVERLGKLAEHAERGWDEAAERVSSFYDEAAERVEKLYESATGTPRRLTRPPEPKFVDASSKSSWLKKKSPEGWSYYIPINPRTGKSLQSEFIEQQIAYMESPEFERIIKEHYGDVDIEAYKSAVLKNLEPELRYSNAPLSEADGTITFGTYSPRQYWNIVIPGEDKRSIAKKLEMYAENQPFDKGLAKVRDIYAVLHELRHQATDGKLLLPSHLTLEEIQQNIIARTLSEKDKTFVREYLSKPVEFAQNLGALKEELKRRGIVDYYVEPITENHINILKNQLAQENPQIRFMSRLRSAGIPAEAYQMNGSQLDPFRKSLYETLFERYAQEQEFRARKFSNINNILNNWDPVFIADKARKTAMGITPWILGGTAAYNTANQ